MMRDKLILIAASCLLMCGCSGNSQSNEVSLPILINETTEKPMVRDIDYEMFIENIYDFEQSPTKWEYKGRKPVIIDFYAEWCGPCKMLSPIVEEMAEEYGDRVDFYKIDIDKEDRLATAFAIKSIPSLLFIPARGKGDPMMSVGLASKSELKGVIENELLKEK